MLSSYSWGMLVEGVFSVEFLDELMTMSVSRVETLDMPVWDL